MQGYMQITIGGNTWGFGSCPELKTPNGTQPLLNLWKYSDSVQITGDRTFVSNETEKLGTRVLECVENPIRPSEGRTCYGVLQDDLHIPDVVLKITSNPWEEEQKKLISDALQKLSKSLRVAITEQDETLPEENYVSLGKLYLLPNKQYPISTLKKMVCAIKLATAASDAEEYFGVIEVSQLHVSIAKLPWELGSHNPESPSGKRGEREYCMMIRL